MFMSAPVQNSKRITVLWNSKHHKQKCCRMREHFLYALSKTGILSIREHKTTEQVLNFDKDYQVLLVFA